MRLFYQKSTLTRLYTLLCFIFMLCFVQLPSTQALAFTAADKVALADFYWWYPWYGAQWLRQGKWQAPVNDNGNLRQDAFRYPFSNPIPYLKSSEHATGDVDTVASTRAMAWFRGNFTRAKAAGIDVMAIMTRPDLPEWKYALGLMIDAIHEMKVAGVPTPKLLFHYDGVEYWNGIGPGSLNAAGPIFTKVSDGTIDTFAVVNAKLAQYPDMPLTDLLYTDGRHIPILVYRVENTDQVFTATEWWITQLKLNFTATNANTPLQSYSLYIIPDEKWCSTAYGTLGSNINLKSCNGDDYYRWSGAYERVILPIYPEGRDFSKAPQIVTIGPGFDNHLVVPSSTKLNPRTYPGPVYTISSQFSTVINSVFRESPDRPHWILIETFNFGEEGTNIDDTVEFGTLYLDLTRSALNSWKGGAAPAATAVAQH